MKGNIYLPEATNIYRGDRLFKEFFSVNYDELSLYMNNISSNSDVIKLFDGLYNKIRSI